MKPQRSICFCGGTYPNTPDGYNVHSGDARHREAVARDVGRLPSGPTRVDPRDEAIRAALLAHDGAERLVREEGLPREAIEPEPVGFLAALEGLGYTVVPYE